MSAVYDQVGLNFKESVLLARGVAVLDDRASTLAAALGAVLGLLEPLVGAGAVRDALDGITGLEDALKGTTDEGVAFCRRLSRRVAAGELSADWWAEKFPPPRSDKMGAPLLDARNPLGDRPVALPARRPTALDRLRGRS